MTPDALQTILEENFANWVLALQPEVKTADTLPSLILRSKPVVEVVSSVPGGE